MTINCEDPETLKKFNNVDMCAQTANYAIGAHAIAKGLLIDAPTTAIITVLTGGTNIMAKMAVSSGAAILSYLIRDEAKAFFPTDDYPLITSALSGTVGGVLKYGLGRSLSAADGVPTYSLSSGFSKLNTGVGAFNNVAYNVASETKVDDRLGTVATTMLIEGAENVVSEVSKALAAGVLFTAASFAAIGKGLQEGVAVGFIVGAMVDELYVPMIPHIDNAVIYMANMLSTTVVTDEALVPVIGDIDKEEL